MLSVEQTNTMGSSRSQLRYFDMDPAVVEMLSLLPPTLKGINYTMFRLFRLGRNTALTLGWSLNLLTGNKHIFRYSGRQNICCADLAVFILFLSKGALMTLEETRQYPKHVCVCINTNIIPLVADGDDYLVVGFERF